MVIIRGTLLDANGVARFTMSLVLNNGEIHHFYPLSDGVHYSHTSYYRGRYQDAVASELQRPNAEIAGVWEPQPR